MDVGQILGLAGGIGRSREGIHTVSPTDKRHVMVKLSGDKNPRYIPCIKELVCQECS
jgi:hypothetical protein